MKKVIPIVALSFAGMALAQQAPPFDEVDTNSDGEISESEFTVVDRSKFEKCDTDEDEYLSPKEFTACTAGDG